MNKFRRILLTVLFLLLFFQLKINAQTVNVKLNGLGVIGVINPAVEFRVLEKWSVQLEGMGIFYSKNFLGTGYPLSLAATWGEFRYYPKKVFKGFFAAPNAGWGVYRLNKNIYPFMPYLKDKKSIFVGQNMMCGLTLGWVFSIGERWNIELSLCGGYQISYYESYTPDKNGVISHRTWNASAEWLAYKGGVFVGYKF